MNRIIGPKGLKQTGGSRELNNQNVHNLHSAPNIIRMIKSRRIMMFMESKNAYRIFSNNLWRRHRRHWHTGTDCEAVRWICLAQDRVQ